MAKQQHHGTGLAPIKWKAHLGRLAVAVLSVVCLTESRFRGSDKAELGKRGSLHPASIEQQGAEFNWSRLVAGPDLNYTRCYGGFQCAKLLLPMDHWNASVKDNISLAVIRQPAKVNVTSERYGGAIMYNPGGPGASGIGSILDGAGSATSDTVDATDNHTGKYFDVISFDPRGVGLTTPEMKCSHNECLAANWEYRWDEFGVLGSSNASLDRKWSMSLERGKCPSDGQSSIRKYMTTASVARDMLSLVEAHGQWRQTESQRIIAGNDKGRNNPATTEFWAYQAGLEKLQYWGASYGSHLGTTFAAMYPDKVGRILVDGVLDSVEYTKGLFYHDIEDSEKGMKQFYSNCARVGYPDCALASKTGNSTAEDVEARVQNITAGLYYHPVQWDDDGPVEVVSYADVENVKFYSLKGPFSPETGFPFLAEHLVEIETGNYNEMPDFYIHSGENYPCEGSIDEGFEADDDAWMGIVCTDADSLKNLTKHDFEEHLEKLLKLSPSFGSVWAEQKLKCIGYEVRPEYRFTGPWVGNTSHAILFIGNSADPITPIGSAIRMARGFKGAVVLTQNSTGHTSSSSPTECTHKHIRTYFQTGELPPNNTICQAEVQPFDQPPDHWENMYFGMRPFGR